MNDESKNIILYERQFRVIKTIYNNKDGISSYPITDWLPESDLDVVMSYFRNKIYNDGFCFCSYEERYVQAKED